MLCVCHSVHAAARAAFVKRLRCLEVALLKIAAASGGICLAPQQMVLKRVPRSRADRGICRGGAARVRAKCCRLGYVGDGLCGRTTGYKGECAIEMSKSREQNHTSIIRFKTIGSFVSGRPERYAKHRCANASCVTRRESGCPQQRL